MVLALNYNMHGVNIRSENAAKPHTMPSRYLCEYIRSIEKMATPLILAAENLDILMN